MKFSLVLCVFMFTSLASQADVMQGKMLQEQSCTRCHDSSVYTRPNRRINSLAALQEQVTRCKRPAGAQWDKEETQDVVEYLNREFYHFK